MSETPPEPSPDAEELAQLRKDKADREKAENDAKNGELETLRKEKADREAADAKKVTPPAKKTAAPPPGKPADAPPAGPKKRRLSRWFDGQDDD